MSRIGRAPITVPAGVDVKLTADNEITVKGKNGTLTRKLHPDMIIKVESGVITVERPSENKEHKSLHGLTRTLINNMVIGVTDGFTRELEIREIKWYFHSDIHIRLNTHPKRALPLKCPHRTKSLLKAQAKSA